MDIVSKRNLWFTISILMTLVPLIAAFFIYPKWFNYGIDFTGGSSLTLHVPAMAQYSDTPSGKAQFIEKFRMVLRPHGFEGAIVQITGPLEVSVRTRPISNDEREGIFKTMHEQFAGWELVEVDTIGPTIGDQLRKNSLWILVLSTMGLLIYLTFRFEFVFGFAAVAATLHDAFVTLGFAALLRVEINTAFVAAIMTILGYSINDTIILFDRVRENLSRPHQTDLKTLLNASIRQTLMRTINTSLTTLIMIAALYLLGGATLKEFSLVLFMGVLCGTYSSIFVAVPLVYVLRSRLSTTDK